MPTSPWTASGRADRCSWRRSAPPSATSPPTGPVRSRRSWGSPAPPSRLSATYDAGWTFAGRTLPGSSASIGALIDDLSTEFGIGTVPAALKSLTLTDLQVNYATATGAFDFACTCTLDVEDTPVTLVATINVTTSSDQDKSDPSVVVGSRGYSAKFGGTITFDNLQFDLIFDLTDDNADIFVADYVAITDSGPTELKALVAALSATLADAVPSGVSIDLQEVKFCFYKKTATLWTFGLRLGTSIDLSQLPVVGSHLPPELTLGLDNLQALYANNAFTADEVKAVNAVLPDKVSKLPDTLAAGIGLQGLLRARHGRARHRHRRQAGRRPICGRGFRRRRAAGSGLAPRARRRHRRPPRRSRSPGSTSTSSSGSSASAGSASDIPTTSCCSPSTPRSRSGRLPSRWRRSPSAPR